MAVDPRVSPLLVLVLVTVAAYVTGASLISAWCRRLDRPVFGIANASHRRIWAARRSSAFVGVAARSELVHLPQPLEELVVEAQRIRNGLHPLDELRPDSQRALWEWLAALARVERRDPSCIERLGIRHAAVAGRLEGVLGAPVARVALADRVYVPGWLHQLMLVDQELWAFIHAARGPGRHGYR